MSEHRADIHWQRDGVAFDYESYSRDHNWDFGHGLQVPASAAPEYLGHAERCDPEQALVAALSSCHMLTFLAIAAKKGFVVDEYHDQAVGVLEKNAEGRLAITRVTLRPRIRFGAERVPSADETRRMHESAHRNCFIANSVRTEVTVSPD
jgi:organic hydroperoxide reductase OsmC/OhrA